ncbi:hypothetical protein NKH19_25170 [Mesorhizobium sp. M1338]|uniref:hypothetical protein n=1 Tax=unclassified Mesorhizobium TaxID=325217 RepID=UPI003335046C
MRIFDFGPKLSDGNAPHPGHSDEWFLGSKADIAADVASAETLLRRATRLDPDYARADSLLGGGRQPVCSEASTSALAWPRSSSATM